MPIIKSAIKRARQSDRRHARLLPYKSSMKTMVKKILDLVKEGKKEEARKLLPQVYGAIDTAAKKKIIHRKNAARKKSRIARLVAKLS